MKTQTNSLPIASFEKLAIVCEIATVLHPEQNKRIAALARMARVYFYTHPATARNAFAALNALSN